ncbi:MAG TPA: fructose-6-phosphate aldolase [Candidatus Nanoarchaeia archaeon]|nr:fructose-6-phosphate aldolase [Candidatus Nanoarchaeia archaeon]
MKLFIDTAEVGDIKKYAFILDGVTTNPTLVMKSGRKFDEVIKEIAGIVDGPISAEVTTLTADEMVKQGIELSKIHKNIVVKVPCTAEGLKACKELTKKGVKVNVTLVFSANQAILAAKCGAYFVSPFIGRLDDIGQTGLDLVEEIVEIYKNYRFKTQVLVASVRTPIHVKVAAKIGADICTCPTNVIESMFRHSLTDAGLQKFMEDAKKVKK